MIPPGIFVYYGKPGTLKTSIALTFPKKLAIFDFDRGSHRGMIKDDSKVTTTQQLIDKGDVTVNHISIPNKSLTTRYAKLEGYRDAWKEFLRLFLSYCDAKDVLTISFDTSTVLWRFDRDSYLEELQNTPGKDGKLTLRKQLLQIEHGEPNARMNTLFDMARSSGTHLVLTHHEADEYIPLLLNGKPVYDESTGQQKSIMTGKKIPDGFRYTIGLADWVFHTYADYKRVNVNGRITEELVGAPYCVMEKSAMGIDLVGMDEEWPTYQKLEALLKVTGRI